VNDPLQLQCCASLWTGEVSAVDLDLPARCTTLCRMAKRLELALALISDYLSDAKRDAEEEELMGIEELQAADEELHTRLSERLQSDDVRALRIPLLPSLFRDFYHDNQDLLNSYNCGSLGEWRHSNQCLCPCRELWCHGMEADCQRCVASYEHVQVAGCPVTAGYRLLHTLIVLVWVMRRW